ncbi:MAG: hypothetical protein DRP08_06050, partial [Candidatus Aenigmatarchaeota archaeon]
MYKLTLKIANHTIKTKIPEKIIILTLFTTALITRTYNLDKFPYYPPQWPYLGDKPGPPGLYGDEAIYLGKSKKLFTEPTTYQTWLQLFLVHLSTRILGESAFSARLPSAI